MPHFFTIKRLLVLGIFFLCVGLVAWLFWTAYVLVRDLPDPGRITERDVVESTKIYDRTGKILLYEIHGEEKRTLISLNSLPDTVKFATIAAEDLHFYEHIGVDVRGIARAFLKNLTRGNIIQGGSTITQQLIKNSILTSERTYTRKIKEVLLAIMLERKYSKDEILELYLNQIPYGSNAYGIAAAAETFFNKEAKTLTLEEVALLAALPKAPTYYSPYGSHKEELFQRKDWIMRRMEESGLVTREVAEIALRAPLSFAPPKQSIRAPHFVMYVREYLNEKYGEEFVERGGLRVITTLDWTLQEKAEQIIVEGAARNEKLVQAKNAALTAIDPRTGEIIVMVGSRDYFNLTNDGNVNVTTRPRQPGSAFKPFVYAAAFKKGFTPETILFDVPTEFSVYCNPDGTPGDGVPAPICYHPNNYDGKFRGPVSLRQSLAQSLNVPSVKLLYLVGVEEAMNLARDMGVKTLTDPNRYSLSLVLGGAEVTLLDMASSFGAFAQEGILHPKTAILRVENTEGLILEEKHDTAVPVLDSEVARTINDILSDNNARQPVFSPTSSLYFPKRQVAAKTGTTQDYRDAWVIGYTPSLVAGVWVGNNDNTPMNQEGLSIMVAGPIWHQFLEAALEFTPLEGFIPPTPLTISKPVFNGQYRTGEIIKIDSLSKKLATVYTPPEFIKEATFGEIKTILALIDKKNIVGAAPLTPEQDSQYRNWQGGIERWLAYNNIPTPIPPQEYDDLHTQDHKPKIKFLSWDPTTKETDALQSISADINASFPLREVSLFINEQLIDSNTTRREGGIFTFSLENSFTSGVYTIRMVVYDQVGNQQTQEEMVTVRERLL